MSGFHMAEITVLLSGFGRLFVTAYRCQSSPTRMRGA